MKITNLAVIACMASLMACNSGKKNESADTGPCYVIDNASYKDSVIIGASKAVAECSIAYLELDGYSNGSLTSESADSARMVVKSVDKWIRHMLGDGDTSVAMGEPLAKYMVKDVLGANEGDLRDWNDAFGKDCKDGFPPMSYEFSYEVKKIDCTFHYLTMLYNSYIYTGGAHGGAASIGQTFAFDDGRMLDMDMFRPGTDDKVLELVKKGLMEQYFEVNTEKEFYDMLLIDDGTLSFPANPPYFETEGVCFLYQQYEIAPYAAGMPACVIPFEALSPYFTESTLQLLDLNGKN